jgi:hypothetical protein
MLVSEKLRHFFYLKVESQPEIAPPQSVSIDIPDEDAIESDGIDPDQISEKEIDGSGIGFAEGQSFLIEYIDSKGNQSTRRITVWGIKEGAGNCPVLVAKCHERNATRTFRIDRIKTVFDYDGVVQEPLEDFFVETFGMARDVLAQALVGPSATTSNSTSSKRLSDPSKDERWNTIRATCRKRGVPLLCLIARADSEFHPTELQIIEEYADYYCRAESIDITQEESESLNGYVRRLRPSSKAVTKCLDQASEWTNGEILHFLKTCAHVVKADGHVDKRELDEISFIVRSLTGQELFEPLDGV